MSDRLAQTGVVAIGRNEGERLIRCLRSLAPSGVPVVYVDSASTDGSATEAASMGATVVKLDMSRRFTAARARAEGFAVLQAAFPGIERVFFIDGDCEIEPGFLAQANHFLDNHGQFAAVCGRRRERFADASPYNGLMDREWATPIGEANACGGDALFRCDAYRQAGGFDPSMIAGEEPELCSRLRACGWRIMRLDTPMTIHDAAMSRFGQWWGRAVRSGMGYAQACWATRSLGFDALYLKELARALLWAGALPLVALGLAIAFSPIMVLLWPGLTLLQWLRLALRQGLFAATLSVTGKYAELLGISRNLVRAANGKDAVQ